MRKFFVFLILCICTFSLLSCTKDGDTIYIDDDQVEDTRPIVYFIYKEGALGDMSYIDAIYRGVAKAANEKNMLLSLAELPSDASNIDYALNYFLEYMKKVGSDRKALVVIANDNYEQMLHHYESVLKGIGNVDILLTETQDKTLPVYSLRFPAYGACYQAGRVINDCFADVNQILIANANPNEANIKDMRLAFTKGIEEGSRKIQIDNYYISDEDNGYDQPNDMYELSYEIDKKYQLVLPICGGSVSGFLRYNREHSNSFYTVGMDTDLQLYSARLPFSIVKHLDAAVEDWILKWEKGEVQPKHQDLGLASGYVELVVADSYKTKLDATVKKHYQTAIDKENEYENQ